MQRQRFFKVLLAVIISAFSGIQGVRIKDLDIPKIVRNGTGPFTLSCIYELEDEIENGLVVKWFHNKNELINDENELIYQWIPPMAPQDIGVISGKADYPDEILTNPKSHSIIPLQEITLEMGGEYTCVVSTMEQEEMRTGRMTVYVPESSMMIQTTIYNQTHVMFTCIVQGAWPRPDFEYRINGVIIKNGEAMWFGDHFERRYKAVVKEPDSPVLIECEIVIPSTDYRRRESIVYYPRKFLRMETAFRKNNSSVMRIDFSMVFYALLILLNSIFV